MMKIIDQKAVIIFLIGFLVILQSCQEKQKDDSPIKQYYSTGELEHEVSLKDSLLHGLSTTYYIRGRKKYEKYFYEEIPIDHHYYYSENGNLIAYNFYDVRGNLRYQVFKDSLNEVYTGEGKSLYIQGEFKENYSEGDSVSLIPIVANPFKSEYKVAFLYEDERIEKTYKFKNEYSPLFLYVIKHGNNPMSIISEISDKDNKVFKRDTISLDFIGK